MKKTIVYSDNTSDIVEDTPKHGVDYCDCCGDCLECQAEDECVWWWGTLLGCLFGHSKV